MFRMNNASFGHRAARLAVAGLIAGAAATDAAAEGSNELGVQYLEWTGSHLMCLTVDGVVAWAGPRAPIMRRRPSAS